MHFDSPQPSLRLACGLILFAMLCPTLISAEPTGPSESKPLDTPRVRIGWTATPPVLDGHMDEAVWLEGGKVDELVQVLPVTGGQPSQRTEIRILTDGKTLYFGFRCYDSELQRIVANRKLRDNFPFFDDRVGISLDTFHTRRNGYLFATNPHGMRHDVLLEGENFEVSWDTIWFVETSIDEEGWTAEIAIPYSSLSFDPESDTWGMNLERGIRRNDEDNRWSDPAPQRFISNVGNAGILEGMLGAEQGLGFEITPGLTVRRIDDPKANDRFEIDPTLDAFYRVLPSVTASVTANTDFGQVEVDDQQVNDDRFALFFPEKRDFFLEDALIFDFGDISQNGRPFFSRRIGLDQGNPVRILGGGKLTGRLGPVKFGLLDTFVDEKKGVEERNLFAGRVAANVLGESTLGAIVTNGNPGGGPGSTTVGGDFLYRNTSFRGGSEQVRASLWFAKSINDDNRGSRRDHGYGIKLEYPQDRINWLLGFEELQEDYRPRLGFVNRNDIRHWFGSGRYRTRPTSGPFRTIDNEVFGQIMVDSGNELETANFRFVPAEFTTPIGDGFDARYLFRYERVRTPFPVFSIPISTYTFHEAALRAFTSRNRSVQVEVELGHGSFFDGTRTRVDASLEWRPSHFLLVEVEYEYRDVNLPTAGARLPRNDRDTQLIRLRTVVQFTADVSWSTFAQYDNVSDRAGINSRLRWIIQDGREFFLVFNQGLETTTDRVRTERSEVLVKAIWTFSF